MRLMRRVYRVYRGMYRSSPMPPKCPLLLDNNKLLTRMINETKVRRPTKPVALGKGQAKVMSYEDVEVARATRAAKEVTKGKGKRGRKRKSAALEADEPGYLDLIRSKQNNIDHVPEASPYRYSASCSCPCMLNFNAFCKSSSSLSSVAVARPLPLF